MMEPTITETPREIVARGQAALDAVTGMSASAAVMALQYALQILAALAAKQWGVPVSLMQEELHDHIDDCPAWTADLETLEQVSGFRLTADGIVETIEGEREEAVYER